MENQSRLVSLAAKSLLFQLSLTYFSLFENCQFFYSFGVKVADFFHVHHLKHKHTWGFAAVGRAVTAGQTPAWRSPFICQHSVRSGPSLNPPSSSTDS